MACILLRSAYSTSIWRFLVCRSTLSRALKFPTFLSVCTQPIYTHLQTSISIMSEHQKSILSQVTLDSHSQSSYYTKIHAGELNYQFYKYSKARKACPQPLPFGSSSSRVTKFLQPISSSKMVSYLPVYPINIKNQQLVTSQVPFGSKENRFPEQKKKIPGPGAYNIKEKVKDLGHLFFTSERKLNIENQNELGPGSYQIQTQKSEKDLQLRQKLKQMIKKKRQKYTVKREKFESNLKMPQLSKIKQEVKVTSPKTKSKGIDRFWLKENTEKYLHSGYRSDNIVHQHLKASDINFSPSFIEKRDNPFSSYIEPTFSPPPTHYLMKQSLQSLKNYVGSSFNSKVQRDLFKAENKGKERIKLSRIL